MNLYVTYYHSAAQPENQSRAGIYLAFASFLCLLVLIPIISGILESQRAAKRTQTMRHIALVSAIAHAVDSNAPLRVPEIQAYDLTANSYPALPPIFKAIALCESGGKQFHANGAVITGIKNRNDIGKYQINLTIWGNTARALGYNIYTEEGNEAMAQELFRRHGLQPWYISKHCWSKNL